MPFGLHLALVTDLAQQTVPPSDISLTLHALRGISINDTEYAAALLTFCDNDFNGISCLRRKSNTPPAHCGSHLRR